MVRSEPGTSNASIPARPAVEIDSGAKATRVTLSLPPDDPKRVVNRKKVLERARRALAATLEDERRAAGKTKTATGRRAAATRPGSGAWWLF